MPLEASGSSFSSISLTLNQESRLKGSCMYSVYGKDDATGLTKRKRNLQFAYTLAIGVVLLLSAGRAVAQDGQNHIQEIMAGSNGNSTIQFIVIQQEGGGNLWGPQTGETQSRMMLQFFDVAGRETAKFKFPHNVLADSNPQLIATQGFASLPGAPTPDFIMPPLLSPISGMVCFTNNPLNSNGTPRTDCVAYGSFAGQTGNDSGGCNGTVTAGPPTAALPIVNTVSLKRTVASTSCGSVPNSDFATNTTPTPTNDAGNTLTIPLAAEVDQGGNLFNNESFQGNGRTCSTCHVATLNLALPPSNIQSRFSTISATFDPLFIGEQKPSAFDAGFDFNLNTLVLTQAVPSPAPCIGTLQGTITSGSGVTAATAKVLTQVSPTTYLVYGGMNPPLAGTVSDSNSCSGTVVSVTAGSLAVPAGSSVLGLEDPKRMRTSADTADFPQGRGLILENIDGFPPTPPVFRKSPHLLNLSQRIGPFGLSGSFGSIEAFVTGAVTQHFPRTLARNSGGSAPDFRLPTSDELGAMFVFLTAQDFPPGTNPNKFDLNQFVVTAAQQRGFNDFFGPAKCSFCHTGTILTSEGLFDTGVVNQTINSAAVDNLPCEGTPCGSRAFVIRQLFNIANLRPFFHDASAATLQDVLAFYNSTNFANSPGSIDFSGPIDTAAIGPTATDDIIAFLEGISFSPFAPTFGPVGTGVTITGFTGATAVSFNGVAATFTVDASGTITTTVPAGATTGDITVTTSGSGPLVTTTRFTVTPAVSSFTPANGTVGTSVTITGTNFTGTTAVSFNGAAAATFTVSNSGAVTATVPFGATTGPINVTTLDGTAISATSFTVTPGGPLFGLGATPSSQTVTAGASASYALNISRAAGFVDNLTFSVAGLPAAATATFTPNPTVGNSSTMTVTTTARAQLAPWTTLRVPPANLGVRAWPLWVICLLVMVLLAYRDRSRRHIPRWVFAAGTFAVLLCVGCGGGSGPSLASGTPAGTYTITVTATSSNTSVQPVSMPVTLIVQ
jgi:hypothetical protein